MGRAIDLFVTYRFIKLLVTPFKDTDTPYNEFLNDDGLSHIIEGGLSLHISYEKTDTNQCRLRAHIE